MKLSELESIKKGISNSRYKIFKIDLHSTIKIWWLSTDLKCGFILTKKYLEINSHLLQIISLGQYTHVGTWNPLRSFPKPHLWTKTFCISLQTRFEPCDKDSTQALR